MKPLEMYNKQMDEFVAQCKAIVLARQDETGDWWFEQEPRTLKILVYLKASRLAYKLKHSLNDDSLPLDDIKDLLNYVVFILVKKRKLPNVSIDELNRGC